MKEMRLGDRTILYLCIKKLCIGFIMYFRSTHMLQLKYVISKNNHIKTKFWKLIFVKLFIYEIQK